MIDIIRTDSNNPDFIALVKKLDAYLKVIDGEEHAFYKQFNNIDVLKQAVVLLSNKKPVACGAFKAFNETSVEIKRMYTEPDYRNKGFAKLILNALELWAKELNYKACILETGKRQKEAVQFYKKNKYTIIPNFGQYKNVENSICFIKQLRNEKR